MNWTMHELINDLYEQKKKENTSEVGEWIEMTLKTGYIINSSTMEEEREINWKLRKVLITINGHARTRSHNARI